MNRHDPAEIAALLAAQAHIPDVGKPAEQPEPEVQTGARMTALGAKVLAMQAENAARLAASDDFGFKAEPAVEAANSNGDPVELPPKVVQVFNVGERYTVAPKGVKVKKINNKFARRILRKRGGEGRVGRAVREGGAQLIDARSVVNTGREAKQLVEAQRQYQREQRALEIMTAPAPPVPYYDGTTVVKE